MILIIPIVKLTIRALEIVRSDRDEKENGILLILPLFERNIRVQMALASSKWLCQSPCQCQVIIVFSRGRPALYGTINSYESFSDSHWAQ